MKNYKTEKRKLNNLIVEYVKEHDFEANCDFYYAAAKNSFEDALEIGINIILKEGVYIDDQIYDNIGLMVEYEGNAYTAGTIQKYINNTEEEDLIAMLVDLKSSLVHKYERLGLKLYDLGGKESKTKYP